MRLVAAVIALALFAGFFAGFFLPQQHDHKEMREMQDEQINELITEGKYRCCLAQPCVSCLDYGGCDCLAEVVEGETPCDECVGGILKGKGNPYLSQYFAKALSDKLGNYQVMQRIIEEKYGVERL